MALKPPLHRADAVPVYVLEADDAWDHERIKAELAELETDEAKLAHPVVRYHSGHSRGDLSTVAAYLDDAYGPWRFVMKPLGLNDWATCRSLLRGSMDTRASIFALKHSLVEVQGCEVSLERGGRDKGPLDDKDAQTLRELVGDQNFMQLGDIAIACSRELLDTEKKP